jgi:hypothetical protein
MKDGKEMVIYQELMLLIDSVVGAHSAIFATTTDDPVSYMVATPRRLSCFGPITTRDIEYHGEDLNFTAFPLCKILYAKAEDISLQHYHDGPEDHVAVNRVKTRHFRRIDFAHAMASSYVSVVRVHISSTIMPSHSPPTWDPIRFSQAEFRLVPLKDFSAAMAQLLFREMFASIFYTLSEFDQKSVMVTIESAIGNWAFVPLVANDY